MRIAVIGAGKMGLPLACRFAQQGGSVIACDVRRDVVDRINTGECPIDEPEVPGLLREMVETGRLRASADTRAAIREVDVVVVIVPALLTSERYPDLSAIESVTRQIAAELRPGMLVSYETTLPVGQTRRLGEMLGASGLQAGRDFSLVFSPERVKSQHVVEHLARIPKVVGGIDTESARKGAEFYRRYLGAPILNVQTLEAAEMTKLAGMVYRDVNIALANELARFAERNGIDFQQVVAAANNDGEAALLASGIGVGGHCTPVYPYLLMHDARKQGVPLQLAEVGRAVNDDQPRWMLDRLEADWQPLRGKSAVILGLGFRPQVREHIFSPAFQIREELNARGVKAILHDPLYSDEEIRAHGFVPTDLSPLPKVDFVILNTAHREYYALPFGEWASRGLRAVIDGRTIWDANQVVDAGLVYVGCGKPSLQPQEIAENV